MTIEDWEKLANKAWDDQYKKVGFFRKLMYGHQMDSHKLTFIMGVRWMAETQQYYRSVADQAQDIFAFQKINDELFQNKHISVEDQEFLIKMNEVTWHDDPNDCEHHNKHGCAQCMGWYNG